MFLIRWMGLSISFYNAISLLWLGLMVLLTGRRRSWGTWLTGGGLLLGALFFTSHTAILGRGIESVSFGMNFWWTVSWTPAVIAPLAWYGAMLWYTGLRSGRENRIPRRHRTGLVTVSLGALAVVALLLFANPIPSYENVAGRTLVTTPTLGGVPLLILAYLSYTLLCYLLPIDALRHPIAHEEPLSAAAYAGARPWLMAASIMLLLAGLSMSALALWTLRATPPPTLADAGAVRVVLIADLVVEGLVALALTLLGRAIVGYAVFTGRPLPRRGFFRQWRSTVILAAGFGTVAAWTLTISLRPIYSLLLATLLMTLFYALYSWRTSDERRRFMAQLRPFLASQERYTRLLDEAPPDRAAPRRRFTQLCRDVLGAKAAALVPTGALTTLVGSPLRYGEDLPLPKMNALLARFASTEQMALPLDKGAGWAVPLPGDGDPGILNGVLILGPKSSGNPYTEEEMELARAGCERILDALASVELAYLTLDVLRQRLAQARVLEGQGRRLLHDEILPQIHTAMITLSSSETSTPEVEAALETLAKAHHQIADLMHEMPLSVPDRLAHQGLLPALRALLEQDFAVDFEGTIWESTDEAEEAARNLPLFVSEVLYFATRELLRNAARHGRGGDSGRALRVSLRVTAEKGLSIAVIDDGAGLHYSTEASGARSGLRFHNAMLTAVGGTLSVTPSGAGGTRGVLHLPPETLGRLS